MRYNARYSILLGQQRIANFSSCSIGILLKSTINISVESLRNLIAISTEQTNRRLESSTSTNFEQSLVAFFVIFVKL